MHRKTAETRDGSDHHDFVVYARDTRGAVAADQNHAAASSAAVSRSALDHAARYLNWCRERGFTDWRSVEDLLDPAFHAPPQLSPFFDPEFYVERLGIELNQRVNPYRHYFEGGWRATPVLSRLVDSVFLRTRGIAPSPDAPDLITLLERIDADDAFTCHALFDPALFRRERPRRSDTALVEFLREPVSHPFSRYVDIDMLHREVVSWDVQRRNALLCYLASPIGTDVNPMLFSVWYAQRYDRGQEGQVAARDMLTDYILFGSRRGYCANPFMMRDLQRQRGEKWASLASSDLLEAIAVSRIVRP